MNTQTWLKSLIVLYAVHAFLTSGAALAQAQSGYSDPGQVVDHIASVRIGDLNLSTPEGMREARERLRKAAENACAEPAKSRGLPRQPNFAACVDSTMAAHLKLIDGLKQQHVRTYETRTANISLADLDLSTLEGARIARERSEAMARRICGKLAERQGLSERLTYDPSYDTCVHDSLAGALAQLDALAAAKNTRTARSRPP